MTKSGKHKDLYGPISSVTVLGKTLIIINDRDLAFQILEKNSIKHSSRPHLVYSASGAFILTITYGYNIEPRGEDPLVRLANLAVKKFSEAAVPGAWLVDFIPALKYVPEWMPGANFQKVAKDHVQTITRFAESPFAFTKAQMDRGKDRQCFVSTLLRQGEDEEIVKWLAAAMYGCAGDTTTAILEGFFLAMMLFPDVQRKAQAEMDELFGKPALPSATDRERLPYVNAIVKEATRWLTVAPLGIPHRTDQDDIINGYLIPKNAIIVPNTWSFNNDPTIYPNPRDFEPERFLSEPGALDPGDVSFGFGRRVCPRRLIVETSIFLIIAHTLAIFDIRKPVENGEEIKSTLDSTAGFLIHFVPFDASITPRSREHEQLIVDFEKTHPFETGDSKVLADAYH
ncbi:hypothetical protein N7455_008569 [Penicillium solitum]|uniref:uncharacterized protein n=1 Tax=Penicillium solitum TaxID=60172 RepID=UPI0032C4719F|nr:hypothetical protein N7455_008569 [Penicillium solitum]